MIIGVGEALPLHGDTVAFTGVSMVDFTIPGGGTVLDMVMDGTTGAGEATVGTTGAGVVTDGTTGAGEATDGTIGAGEATITLTTIPATGLATMYTIGVTHTMPAEGAYITPIPGLGALP
jgi:hypothetical protein